MINEFFVTDDPCLRAEQFFFLKQSQIPLTSLTLECSRCNRADLKQEQLVAESETLLRTVAHELKHPLSIIASSAQLLQVGRTPMAAEEQELLLEQIVQHSLKMSHIIDELLLLSSITEVTVEFEPLAMGDILIGVRQQLADLIEARQAVLTIPTTWPTAMGYAPWIERVWVNYVSNALKYGGDPPQIELGAVRQRDGTIRFWVQDNGPGLTQEEQTQLFEPFTQLNLTQTDGHGLGLSIVQRIVEKLGGQVGVDSSGISGLGCTFYFTLPGTPI